jgi:hypothetical protein
MSNGKELAPDIAVLLAQTWRASSTQTIGFDVICRIWAYDLGWFDITTSTRVRDNLIETGWIQIDGAELSPSITLDDVEIPFSWMPSMRVLDNPPLFSKASNSQVEVIESKNNQVKKIEEGAVQTPHDPAASHIKPLLEKISELSGIERKEIMRRAQRKRNALGPVTLWMAILLVAREQRIAMSGLMLMLTD